LVWAKEFGKGSAIFEEIWKQIPKESDRSPPRPAAASLPCFPSVPKLQKFSTLLLLLSRCAWGMGAKYLFLWWCQLAINWLYTDY